MRRPHPRTKPWYLAALILAAGAIVVQFLAQRYAGLGMTTMARSAVALNMSKRYADSGMETPAIARADESARLKRAAYHFGRKSGLWGRVGLGLAFLATLYWPSARYHREAGTRRTLVALLAVYVLLLLLVV